MVSGAESRLTDRRTDIRRTPIQRILRHGENIRKMNSDPCGAGSTALIFRMPNVPKVQKQKVFAPLTGKYLHLIKKAPDDKLIYYLKIINESA